MPDRPKGFADLAKSQTPDGRPFEGKTRRGLSLLDRLLPYFEPKLGSNLLSKARLSIRQGRVIPALPDNQE